MATARPEIIVVGGGVIGVCCAYYLARRGAEVLVLEKKAVGEGASFGNAGAIVPGHLPINKPGRVRQALGSMLDPLSPLHVAPRWAPDLVRWLWDFSRSCSPSVKETASVFPSMSPASCRQGSRCRLFLG